MRKCILLAIIIITVILAYFLYSKALSVGYFSGSEGAGEERAAELEPPVKKDRVLELEIKAGDTYGKIMDEAVVDFFTATDIYQAAEPIYDLARLRASRTIELVYDKDSDELKELWYKIDSEEELFVKNACAKASGYSDGTSTPSTATTTPMCAWSAGKQPIPYQVKMKTAEGMIETSMYEAALAKDIDIRAIIELANAFQWTIDFALDPRVGDTFKFIYEERYLNNEYVMPGQVFAGKYVNDGKAFYVYYFEESEENKGFFDQDGNSVQKLFLKAPVAFKYISSGFTTGLRYIQAFNIATGHRAIDYAAAAGTPVRAVGDGTVVFVGWDGSYGRKISVHHNATYSTNYAHLSGYAVKSGQKVKQGDVIGYVGSTGLSTGPHLHYEMVKYGVKVNPLQEVLPPGEPIKEENRERYFSEIKQWQEKLK